MADEKSVMKALILYKFFAARRRRMNLMYYLTLLVKRSHVKIISICSLIMLLEVDVNSLLVLQNFTTARKSGNIILTY